MKKLLLSLSILLSTIPCFSQLIEGFENTTGIVGPLPAIWPLSSGNWAVFERNTPATVGSSQSWGINSFATGLQYGGDNCASVSREQILSGSTSQDYLATPAIHILDTGSSVLRFYTRTFTAGNQGTLFKIMIAPALSGEWQTDPTAYSVVQTWTETDLNTTSGQYEEKIVDLSAYAGFDVYIAFVREHTQPTAAIDGDRWLIDNVSYGSANQCFIGNQSAVYTSPTTIDLSWATNNTNPVEVLILPCEEPYPAPSVTGIPVTGNTYQFTGLMPHQCYRCYIKNTCPGSTGNWVRVSTSVPFSHFNMVAFIDTNNNGVKDVGEDNFKWGNFIITENYSATTYNVYSSSGTHQLYPSFPFDTFDIGYQIPPNYAGYYTLGSFIYDDISLNSQAETLYFPIIETQAYYDAGLAISASGRPVPGQIDQDHLTITNYSAHTITSGQLTYTKAPNVTIASVIPSPNTGTLINTLTGFTYDFSNLTTYQSFNIGTNIPPIPTVNLGDLVTSSASVSISNTDALPTNNSYSLTQTVAASYDPNDITESRGPKIQFDEFGANDYLYYTIHFQNTGNANTTTVRVEDVLDSMIDESSISPVASSHQYVLERTGSNLVWNFQNAILTPASVSEALSQGYVQYKVKLKPGFAIGDIIPNTASIYFDTNPAIVTNTFNTEFVQALGNPTFDSNAISLAPNPTSNLVTITNSSAEKISTVAIYDLTGKKIFTLNNAPDSISIDVSNFSKGIYLIELSSESNSKITKKLILK